MKNLRIISAICLFVLSSLSYAHSPRVDLSRHRFTVGTSWTNFATSSFWLNVGGMTDRFVWRVAAASTLFRDQIKGGSTVDSFNAICGTLHLGGRKPLSSHTGFEYGLAGGILDFNGRPNVSTQRSIGAYVGLDHFLSNHLMMHASVQPYAYRKNINDTINHQIFEQGTIGLSYLF